MSPAESDSGGDTARGMIQELDATLNPRNFFAELKRRNVYKVAVAYAVIAWLLI